MLECHTPKRVYGVPGHRTKGAGCWSVTHLSGSRGRRHPELGAGPAAKIAFIFCKFGKMYYICCNKEHSIEMVHYRTQCKWFAQFRIQHCIYIASQCSMQDEQ